MHILVLSHYYPPEVNAPASRMSEHARAWVALGHKVTIVTCAPNHPDGKLYPGFRNRLFDRQMIDGIEIIRIWTWLAANQGFTFRTLSYISYFVSVALQAWRLPKADIVLSSSPQFFCGLAGALLQRRNRPWVLEIRDLWPESIIAVGAMRRSLLTRLLEGMERFAYRRADLVVSVTDSFVGHIAPSRPGKPIAVIKNGVDLSQFTLADEQEIADFRAAHGLEGKFIAGYVGTHGMAHGLDTMLEAAEALRDTPDVALLMVGTGADRERIRDLRDQRGLTNVVMLDQQPKSAMPVIWSAIDAALILLKRLDTFKSVLPSKMFEAMALQRPIVMGVEGEASVLMAEAEAGIAITPEDAPALAEAVRVLARDRAASARMGANGALFVRRHFDRVALAKTYIEQFDLVLAKRREGEPH